MDGLLWSNSLKALIYLNKHFIVNTLGEQIMLEKINWSFNVQVVSGPRMSLSQTIEVEAYDKIQVTVEDDGNEKEVQIQPGGSGQVSFLLIKSDKYDETKLTYYAKDNTGTSGLPVNLDMPHFLTGKGAVAMLVGAPESLFFKNDLGADNAATIQILVGRDATP